MAFKFVETDEKGKVVREFTPEEFAALQESEKTQAKAERYITLLNSKRESVERQNRILAERRAAVADSEERRDRFSQELADLLSKENDRVPAGFSVSQHDDSGAYVLVETPVAEADAA